MCDERRALFQWVNLMGDQPRASISINPTLWQWWVSITGTLVAIVVGLWTGIAFVSDQVFDQRLNQFHEKAKPEIRRLIQEEVSDHAAQPAHGDVVTRLRTVERENAAEARQLEENDKRLGRIDSRLLRIEDKLDILIRNGKK